MSHHPGQVGSDEHYQSYKAEYEIKEKTASMMEDIKEVSLHTSRPDSCHSCFIRISTHGHDRKPHCHHRIP